ncbi:hypothetical protein KIN20_016174, partial [Parelaphostrongylus tenuis]
MDGLALFSGGMNIVMSSRSGPSGSQPRPCVAKQILPERSLFMKIFSLKNMAKILKSTSMISVLTVVLALGCLPPFVRRGGNAGGAGMMGTQKCVTGQKHSFDVREMAMCTMQQNIPMEAMPVPQQHQMLSESIK